MALVAREVLGLGQGFLRFYCKAVESHESFLLIRLGRRVPASNKSINYSMYVCLLTCFKSINGSARLAPVCVFMTHLRVWRVAQGKIGKSMKMTRSLNI
jgi:hypothetical protein